MQLLKKCILFTLIYMLIADCFGQQANVKPLKAKELAQVAELNGDVFNAILYYEIYYKKNSKADIKEKLVELYFETKQFRKIKNIIFNLGSNEKLQNSDYYKLGLVSKQLGEYDSCLYYFALCNKNKLSGIEKHKLKIEQDGAAIAMEAEIDTTTIQLFEQKGSLNSKFKESAPCYINDSLIIYNTTTYDNDLLNSDSLLVQKGSFRYAIKQNQLWRPTNQEISLNSAIPLIDNGCFSLDFNRFYFTSTIANWNNKNISQLYVCEYENGKFGKPLKLDSKINDIYYSSTQPTVGTTYNPVFEIVYFASDRPGGKGGMDIWYTIFHKTRGTFSEPINAGKINGLFDEITPYYDITTKTLYFSSNSYSGFGGFDVFASTGELKSWTTPSNLGNYLNTNFDEIYFCLNNSRDGGFFASNRPVNSNALAEYCCNDLFYFIYKNPDRLKVRGSLLTKMNPIIEKILKNGIEFRDSSLHQKYLKDAIVSLYLKINDGIDSLYISSDTTSIKGAYEFNVGKEQDYSLIIHDNNELKAQVNVTTKGFENQIATDIELDIDPIETLPEQALIVKNIYYDFGSSELNNESKQRLDSTLVLLMKAIRTIHIEISSHTDNIGEEDYNQKLSEQRAEKVAEYLISKGIGKSRISTIGFGESVPLVPNTFPDGTDNPQGRERNRRTEFKIIKSK